MKTNIEALNGLSQREVEVREQQYGKNILPRARRNVFVIWGKRLIAPVPLMLIAAAALSFILGKHFDGWFIVVLFIINFGVSIWHERKANHALELLENRMVVNVKVLRDNTWQFVDSRMLVPGDIIELASGSVIPADATVISGNQATANESALTGESLPVEKKVGDPLSMGSFIASGIIRATITAIGAQTHFGKVIARESGPRRRSALEQDILSISKFLSGIAIVIAVILSIILYISGKDLFEIIRLDLTLLIAGIPVALPVVMSLIISVGVLRLSERAAIVRRLAALEDLANVDLLLSDKTGTLTKNEIKVHETVLFSTYSKEQAAALAATTEINGMHHALGEAVIEHAKLCGVPTYDVAEFVSADSVRKRSTAFTHIDGIMTCITLGAPQIIKSLSHITPETEKKFDDAIEEAARRGFRTLALAIRTGTNDEKPEEKDMLLVALFLLSDTLRVDAPDIIEFLRKNGIGVKMLTGDNVAVAEEIAKQLRLKGNVTHMTQGELQKLHEDEFEATAVFAEVLPEDKEHLVRLAQKRHTVAVTGDGVNDLPAVRIADVGVAVANAVDALKSVADIVLMENGISIIHDAIIESRKIFMRIYSYSVYRISESFRVIITVAVFGTLFLAPILTPLQLLMLALLNDLPIISLAFNRVRISNRPASIDAKKRFTASLLFGLVGIINSILFFFIARYHFGLPWETIQTLFFLKLTVSGHMLIFIAHTEEVWYRYLPSRTVIIATVTTQIIATIIAVFGIFMTGIPLWLAAFVWIWAFFWMQIGELTKSLRHSFVQTTKRTGV